MNHDGTTDLSGKQLKLNRIEIQSNDSGAYEPRWDDRSEQLDIADSATKSFCGEPHQHSLWVAKILEFVPFQLEIYPDCCRAGWCK